MPRSIAPTEPRDYTKARTANGDTVYDVGENKKAWEFENEVALGTGQLADLNDLYVQAGPVILTENWLEYGTSHVVMFEAMTKRLDVPKGDLKFTFRFQEL